MTHIEKIETFSLRLNGHHVRKATRVIFSDGRKVEFLEKMSKREAAKQAVGVLISEHGKASCQ